VPGRFGRLGSITEIREEVTRWTPGLARALQRTATLVVTEEVIRAPVDFGYDAYVLWETLLALMHLVTSCSDEDGGEDSDDDAADARSAGGDDGSESDAEADMEGLDDDEESVASSRSRASLCGGWAGAARRARRTLCCGASSRARRWRF